MQENSRTRNQELSNAGEQQNYKPGVEQCRRTTELEHQNLSDGGRTKELNHQKLCNAEEH